MEEQEVNEKLFQLAMIFQMAYKEHLVRNEHIEQLDARFTFKNLAECSYSTLFFKDSEIGEISNEGELIYSDMVRLGGFDYTPITSLTAVILNLLSFDHTEEGLIEALEVLLKGYFEVHPEDRLDEDLTNESDT